MPNPITIKQRVSLSADGRSLEVRQEQNGQVRRQQIALAEPKRRVKDIHNITELARDWPKTELKLDTELAANLEEPKTQP